MLFFRLFCLCCLLFSYTPVFAAVPLKTLIEQVDNLDPKAMTEIERHLQDGTLTPQQRAQLLQLKSVIHLNNLRMTEARAVFEQALAADAKLSLLGNLSPNNRAKYEAWRSEFLQKHTQPIRRPPPPNTEHRTTGRILYGVLFGLGIAAAVGGGIASVIASGHIDEYNKLQGDPKNAQKKIELHNSAQTFGIVGISSLIGGGVLIVAGVIVAVLVETSAPPKPLVSTPTKHETHSLLLQSF